MAQAAVSGDLAAAAVAAGVPILAEKAVMEGEAEQALAARYLAAEQEALLVLAAAAAERV
jgi:hypothetical protein